MRRKFYFMVLVGALATLVPLGTVVGTAHASVYLGSNFLVAGKVNTISDVSYADKTPGSLSMGDVIFGYQSLGQVANPTATNLPSGSAWVLFSFQVSAITSGTGLGLGSTYISLAPTPAADPHSLQTLVPTLFAQTGLASSDPLLALEVNSVPNGSDASAGIFANGTMTGAMSSFNTGPFSTEFAFGNVAANGDFLTVYASNANLVGGGPVTEAGGASVLFDANNYQSFMPIAISKPNSDGTFTPLMNQVAIDGTVYQQPGIGAAPPSATGALATDHATYTFKPLVPEPASIAVWSLLALIVGATRMRSTR